MDTSAKIFIAGHQGFIGSAIVRSLKKKGYKNLLVRTRAELDLSSQTAVSDFFATEKPDFVIDSAAKVGGIQENVNHPATFLYENLQIQNNLMWAAKDNGVKKFLFIASACVYPSDSPQPIKEEYFLQGPPNAANRGYAHAKIAGIQLCEYISDEFGLAFTSVLPTNIYGVHDNFDPQTAHVIPALIRRMHEAKLNNTPEVTIWGKGLARREFLYVEDLADAIVFLLENYEQKQFLNIGTGEDISMRELAEAIQKLVGYEGTLVFDPSRPEGNLRRVYDVSHLHETGWKHSVSFAEGLKRTYDWYLKNVA